LRFAAVDGALRQTGQVSTITAEDKKGVKRKVCSATRFQAWLDENEDRFSSCLRNYGIRLLWLF
jgi:hypothetical protein